MKKSKKARILSNLILGKNFIKKTPFWVDFKLTDRCNLRCSYCNLWSRKTKELSTKGVFKLIDELERDCVLVYLTGGEPLLRDDIGEIIDYINKKDGMLAILFTNGVLIPEKIQDIRNIDLVNLSFRVPAST